MVLNHYICFSCLESFINFILTHGLCTLNEGIIQRNLKFWANVSAIPKNLGLGFDFRPEREGNFLTGCPKSVLSSMTFEDKKYAHI